LILSKKQLWRLLEINIEKLKRRSQIESIGKNWRESSRWTLESGLNKKSLTSFMWGAMVLLRKDRLVQS